MAFEEIRYPAIILEQHNIRSEESITLLEIWPYLPGNTNKQSTTSIIPSHTSPRTMCERSKSRLCVRRKGRRYLSLAIVFFIPQIDGRLGVYEQCHARFMAARIASPLSWQLVFRRSMALRNRPAGARSVTRAMWMKPNDRKQMRRANGCFDSKVCYFR